MTAKERIDYVNALYQLRLGDDLIADISNFHKDFFNLDDIGDGTGLDIHFNLPDEPERDIFLAWHRAQIMELERGIQHLFPYLSVPYVDWTIDTDVNSPLWDENFLGQFNEDWNLERTLGERGQLPLESEIEESINSTSDYLLFSNDLERGSIHAGPHNWVGGFMSGGSSPRDPVFYLHHTFVDKVWSEWEALHNNSSFLLNSMIRYDGTYVFNGEVVPNMNPNDLTNTNAIGVFYAEDAYVFMSNYAVSNNFLPVEYFYYQFQIDVGNDFIVPEGKNCKIESRDQIVLKPGFHAIKGSTFIASIDSDQSKLIFDKNLIVRNQIPFQSSDDDFINVYSSTTNNIQFNQPLRGYPNPFIDHLIIGNLDTDSSIKVVFFNQLGVKVFAKSYANHGSGELRINDLEKLKPGIYLVHIIHNNQQSILKFWKR